VYDPAGRSTHQSHPHHVNLPLSSSFCFLLFFLVLNVSPRLLSFTTPQKLFFRSFGLLVQTTADYIANFTPVNPVVTDRLTSLPNTDPVDFFYVPPLYNGMSSSHPRQTICGKGRRPRPCGVISVPRSLHTPLTLGHAMFILKPLKPPCASSSNFHLSLPSPSTWKIVSFGCF
jgi:hypothetical protein